MTAHQSAHQSAHLKAHRLSVAPMMDWTDRHCRVFHRLLAPEAMLFSEMVTADAIIHGDRDRLLMGHHTDQGDPVALQLGGSDPQKLAQAITLAAPYRYSEYNLNVGCPSDRVQSGRFGACLMAEPELVRDCMTAMITAAGDTPVTVKCRIGIDDMDPETGLDTFVETVARSGVRQFIIHARKAWLNGLSPKENRTIPPLDYDRVMRLRDKFRGLDISINGGINEREQAVALEQKFSGVMIGRAAYQTPYLLAQMSAAIYGHDVADRFAVAMAMADYADARHAEGVRLIAITRHMLGLMNGLPGAKAWRRALSEEARGEDADGEVIRAATSRLQDSLTSTENAA
ncbi:MAG: tRNA dihydrouridine(20/20a) synthase DusA [Alphaproteobacteria bacterium]|nr:tRNA dihydrouridine(20/20a) synthase DusA [Alphaproteobacteria bacterium]